MGRHCNSGLRLAAGELARAFEGSWGTAFPPILSAEQAAELAQVSVKTIYDWSHRGLLAGCALRRGRRLRVFRDRFVRFLFEEQEQS